MHDATEKFPAITPNQLEMDMEKHYSNTPRFSASGVATGAILVVVIAMVFSVVVGAGSEQSVASANIASMHEVA